jgi:hypothetical protein
MNLEYFEGRKLCVVFVKVVDAASERVQLSALRGRADVENGKLSVVHESGHRFTVPHTALANILPNDGTEILGDCEYYVLVKTDPGIPFEKPDYMD